MDKHTPTPWEMHKTLNRIAITSVTDKKIAGMAPYMIASIEKDLHIEDQEANASFIVRAVNSHKTFLNLAYALKERIEVCPDCDGSGKEHETSACGRCGGIGKVLENCTGLIDSVHEVIARAEGRTK